MTIQQMVAGRLRSDCMDGLYSSTGGCACRLDDLMPCGEPGPGCQAGVLAPCPGGDDCEMGGGCDWHIVPAQREAAAAAVSRCTLDWLIDQLRAGIRELERERGGAGLAPYPGGGGGGGNG